MVWPRDFSVWSTVGTWSGKKSDLALSGLATILENSQLNLAKSD